MRVVCRSVGAALSGGARAAPAVALGAPQRHRVAAAAGVLPPTCRHVRGRHDQHDGRRQQRQQAAGEPDARLLRPLLLAAGALGGAALLADVHAAAADGGAKPVDAASKFGGYRSSRYASLPDMVEDVFPGLCKMMGAVGGRKLGGGSGFVISEDGLVVSNAHVYEAMAQAGALELQAVFDDGRAYRVEHIASDDEADIAVGRIVAPPGTKFKPLRVGRSSDMRRGDLVAVLGAPLGGGLVPSVGVLSGIRYVADDEIMHYVLGSRSDWCLLQVDASMSSGSSGGPIVNADGEVVGVSVMVQTAAGMGGVGFVNYGVAIDQAWPVIQALVSRGRVQRSFIGLTIVGVDPLQNEREVAATGVSLLPPGSPGHTNGLLVTYVVPSRAADKGGIREGDVLLEINGRKLVRKGDYFAALGPVYDPGHTLRCTVYRPPPPGSRPGAQGTVFTTTVTPEVRDGDAEAAERPARRRGAGRR